MTRNPYRLRTVATRIQKLSCAEGLLFFLVYSIDSTCTEVITTKRALFQEMQPWMTTVKGHIVYIRLKSLMSSCANPFLMWDNFRREHWSFGDIRGLLLLFMTTLYSYASSRGTCQDLFNKRYNLWQCPVVLLARITWWRLIYARSMTRKSHFIILADRDTERIITSWSRKKNLK